MSNFGNAPAGRNVDSISYFAHVAGGVEGVTPTGLIEGAIAVVDPTGDCNQALLPSGPAVKNVAGVVTDYYGAGGPAEGKPVSVRYLGVAGINIAANTAISRGDFLIAANSAGDAKPWTNEADCVVVAEALETISAQPARGRVASRLLLQYQK